MTNFQSSALLLLFASCLSLSAQSLLVLSKKDHTVSIVDPTSLQILGTAPVGEDPHEIVASSDGKTAYISNYGFGAYNTIAVVDLTTRKALPSIDLGPLYGAHGLTFVGGKLWFTAETEKVIARYDPAVKKVDWVLGTGQNRTHMLNVSPDLHRILTTNVNSTTVSIMNWEPIVLPRPQNAARNTPPPVRAGLTRPTVDWNEYTVKVGNGSEGFDLSPDQKEIWVANQQDGTVSIVNLASKSVTDTLQTDAPNNNRLKFTLDGAHVLVSYRNGLVILDAATRKEVKRLPIGHGCAGILIEPTGKRAFVACSQESTVTAIDLATLEAAQHIDGVTQPDGLAWATSPKP